ncbi:MAG TPA: efflux RND transporter periplasmic adaptor subunit [Isosphaeraceae bacterium]|nr:efflux RND transporter periplasmic adaptor subunit [Isosphaeraceae bacterium]
MVTGRWMFLALLSAGVAGCHSGAHTAEVKEEHRAKTEGAHVAVRVEPARRSTLVETVEGLGRSEAIPDRLATLTPAVEGHVHALLVKQGETVTKGQPIVELDKAVARADLAEKTATRDSLKAALALLKSLPRPEERRANELAVEQAKVALERARRVAERLRPLLARREISEQQVFEADLAATQAQLQLQSAEAQLRAMMIGPRPGAVAEAEAKIKTAEAAVEFSQAHLDYHTIRSPIDGVLDSLTCHPGQTIAIGAPIGEVVDTRQVFASVWLPSGSAQAVRVGQVARVKIADSRPESSGGAAGNVPTSEGKVDFIGRVADPQTGNLPVRVLVDNPEGRLTVGLTVGVTLAVNERPGVLEVPAVAILDLGEGPVLGVVRDGKTVVLHPEVGVAHGGWVAVSGTDLKEGEPVIVEGGYNLPEGTPVNAAPEKVVARAEPQR